MKVVFCTVEKKALMPIIGKVLSFLFGTLDETDLDTIKTNVSHLANNQQQIKGVLQRV